MKRQPETRMPKIYIAPQILIEARWIVEHKGQDVFVFNCCDIFDALDGANVSMPADTGHLSPEYQRYLNAVDYAMQHAKVTHYGADNESFSMYAAARKAVEAGKHMVIVEGYS